MVAQDIATAWDLKPNRENTNQIFNVLCNVQPVEHPWSGDGYNRQVDVTTGSKEQYRFEKCKGLKRCKLYEYQCDGDHVDVVIPQDEVIDGEVRASSKKRRNEALRSNSNFTDVILFQGYRIYMRKNNVSFNPYGESAQVNEFGKEYVSGLGDGNKNTCDEGDRPSDNLKDMSIDKDITTARNQSGKLNTYNTSDRIRLYIQKVDTKVCTGDSFDEADSSPIILAKEYEAAECNPDHFVMGYGGIGTPKILSGTKIAMIMYGGQLFAYLYGTDFVVGAQDWLLLKEEGIYISGLSKPTPEMNDIISYLDLPGDGYMIPNTSELTQVLKIPADLPEGQLGAQETTEIETIHVFSEWGEVPYFAAKDKLYSINGFFSRKDGSCNIPKEDEIMDVIDSGGVEDETPCKSRPVKEQEKRIFLFDNNVVNAANEYAITGLAHWGARLVYVAGGKLYVSGNGTMNGLFSPDTSDVVRGAKNIPAGITDVRIIGGSLIMMGPKTIYAVVSEETLQAGYFVNGTDNEDGYYSPGSYYNDDGEFLLLRRGKVLGNLQMSVGYSNSASIAFDPSTGFYITSHLKSLNGAYDNVNIDATVNHRYISIFDNNDVGEHYSKLLIYDKHYKCWYHWMITGARVVHVKDDIFLGDGVYVNKGRTRGWENKDTEGGEIIEIISAYVGEEGLQAPKHIQYVKTAIGDHSVITNDSYWDIDTSYGGKLFERRNNITTTRYPRLLTLKNRLDVIETYEIGEQIYGHGRLLSHNLLNEISEYRSYDKFSKTIIREMGEDIDLMSRLALFASIKEPVNAPANVLELSISARHLDNVQFGSFYVGYYPLDADFEDIENTNIDVSDASDRTKEYTTVINKGEYCDEILEGSACDIQNF